MPQPQHFVRAKDGVGIAVQEVAYHRNGVGGAPFYAVRFQWTDDDHKPRQMVGVVFEEPYTVAVLDIEELGRGNIAFAQGNSWRGDHFEEALRMAIGPDE